MRLILGLIASLLLLITASLHADTGRLIVAGTFYTQKQAQTRNDQLKAFLRHEPEANRFYQQGRYRYDVRQSGKHYLSVLERFQDFEEMLSVLSSIRKIYPDAYVLKAFRLKSPVKKSESKPVPAPVSEPESKPEKKQLSTAEQRIIEHREQTQANIRPPSDDTIVVIDETKETVQERIEPEVAAPEASDVASVETEETPPSSSGATVLIYIAIAALLVILSVLLMMLRHKKTPRAPLVTPEPVLPESEPAETTVEAGATMEASAIAEPETVPAAAEAAVEVSPVSEPEAPAAAEPESALPEAYASPRKKRSLEHRAEHVDKEDLADFAGNRILVAEDNLINQKVITKLLEESGIELVMANNGQEALDILEKDQDFGMVLMDAHMPVKDGFEATRDIRANILYEPIVVVALSGDVSSDDLRKMREAGMEEQLAKPLRVEALYDVLYQYLDLAGSNESEEAPLTPETAPQVEKALYPYEGIEICGGDKDMYIEILDEFVQTYQHADEMLETHLAAHNDAAVIGLMLDIRGVAGNIGAIALSYSAEMLREAVLANETEKYAALKEDFSQKLYVLLEAIAEFKRTA